MAYQSERKTIPFRLQNEVRWMVLLFALSLMVRLLYVIPTGFDGLYGQDAYAYYDFAQVLRESISAGTPLQPFFWPLGYPALLAAGFSMFGTTPTVAQAINVLLGSALAALVYVLARQCSLSRSSATVSAVVMMVCGQAVQSSLVVMSDIPALFWATASAVTLLSYINETGADETMPHPYSLIAASLMLALASVTRWIYLVLFIPWGIALVIGRGWRIRWLSVWVMAGAAGVVVLPQYIYSQTNPAATLNHAFVEGWSPGSALLTRFTTIEGHFEYQKINAVFYAQPFFEAYYLSPVFTPLLIIGGWWMVRGKRKLNRQDAKTKNLNHRVTMKGITPIHESFRVNPYPNPPPCTGERTFRADTEDTKTRGRLIIFAGWAVLPYLFLIGIPYQNIRFPLIVFPGVAVLVGYGFEWIAEQSKNLIRKTNYRQFVWLVIFSVVIGGIGQTLAAGNSTINQFIKNQQRDKATAAWVAERVPEEAMLYTFGLTLTLKHYTTLDVYELYYETPATLAAKWRRGQEDYLLINVWNIEKQWKGREPQIDYHWLRDARGVEEIGKSGYYTLFRIGG